MVPPTGRPPTGGDLAAGSAFLGMGAQANSGVSDHCDATDYPNKVEVNAGTMVQTGLAPDTVVCIKAGTKTTLVRVDANGYITQNDPEIMNKPRNAFLGISYYAYGDENCEPKPSGPVC